MTAQKFISEALPRPFVSRSDISIHMEAIGENLIINDWSRHMQKMVGLELAVWVHDFGIRRLVMREGDRYDPYLLAINCSEDLNYYSDELRDK